MGTSFSVEGEKSIGACLQCERLLLRVALLDKNYDS